MSQRKYRRAQQKMQKKGKVEPPPSAERQPSIQALVWYREEDWEALKALFDDADMLPPSYEEWLKRATELEERGRAEGDAIIKVYIDPQTFPAWCEKKGLSMDAEARSQLAIEVAQAQSFSL